MPSLSMSLADLMCCIWIMPDVYLLALQYSSDVCCNQWVLLLTLHE